MKKNIIFLLFIISTISCSKEKIEIIETKIDRLSFKNIEEFNETYKFLSKITSTEELLFWAKRKNHQTLLLSTDSTIYGYSNALKTILNKDSEIEIGDSVIQLNKGTLYAYKKPSSNQKTPNKKNIIGSVKTININHNISRSANIGLNSIDARNQKEFTQKYYQPCGGVLVSRSGLRKYVNELYDETISYGSVRNSHLYLRIKLEWKGRSWKPASEQREIRVNISGSAGIFSSGNKFSINNAFFDCYSGNKDILIGHTVGAYPTTPYWIVSMTGSIYQKIKGDIESNAWTNSGTLW